MVVSGFPDVFFIHVCNARTRRKCQMRVCLFNSFRLICCHDVPSHRLHQLYPVLFAVYNGTILCRRFTPSRIAIKSKSRKFLGAQNETNANHHHHHHHRHRHHHHHQTGHWEKLIVSAKAQHGHDGRYRWQAFFHCHGSKILSRLTSRKHNKQCGTKLA